MRLWGVLEGRLCSDPGRVSAFGQACQQDQRGEPGGGIQGQNSSGGGTVLEIL